MAASEQTSGRLSQKALPGLKSVASATAAPASTSVRAGRHRPSEEERARREQHAGDVARGECCDAVVAGRLQVVDRARAELDRERDRSLLGELVAVEPEREAGVAAGGQIAARLCGVEGAALEEDVRRLGDARRLGEHLGEREVEVGVRVVELGRHGVGAEPGRDRLLRHVSPGAAPARCRGRARSRTWPRRWSSPRARIQPRCRSMRCVELGLGGGARRPDGREDPAARPRAAPRTSRLRRGARTPRRGRRRSRRACGSRRAPGSRRGRGRRAPRRRRRAGRGRAIRPVASIRPSSQRT